jgi:5-oxoprolinase (ATP-hydrolysing)
MSNSSIRWRIGFDIGGTFTDFVLYDAVSGRLKLHKKLTTPHDPSEAALAGLLELTQSAGIRLRDVDQIVHGTTLVTNAVIERKGSKLGLITTHGFRDVLEMGREQRYDIYDLFLTFPEPMVPRDLRLEVSERLDRDGNVVQPLDREDVRRKLAQLLARGVDAIAVCLLHSYRNPTHELEIARIAREEFPSLVVCISSDVVAEISEYERCVTTCANAYVQPLMNAYLCKLEDCLRADGFRGSVYLMHSAGGLVSLDAARAFPIRLLESGPAGGALATALFGKLAGKDDVIAFDMGGTTAKACLIEGGRVEIAPMLEAARVNRFARGSGLPIKTPTVDLIEIGAGGGSIATVDEVGLLKVGPRSAGSDPGPACYGLGGAEATVTDANVVLGYYDPSFFLGGRMKLDTEAAQRAVAALANRLGVTAHECAWGIHQVVVQNMAAATRVHLVEKGLDPREYAMVGFGGAGPAHACDVARVLGVREVIIPPASGAASALGFLTAPMSVELVRSMPLVFSAGMDLQRVNDLLTELEAACRSRLHSAGVPDAEIVVERSCDMRLVGQSHEIEVRLTGGALLARHLSDLRAAFEAAYSARYTRVFSEADFEAINFRVRCAGRAPELQVSGAGAKSSGPKHKGTRRAWFGTGFVQAGVYDRYALVAGDVVPGPAIIEEHESTTVIAPGDAMRIDENHNMRISVAAAGPARQAIHPDMPLAEAVAVLQADSISLEIMWSRLVTVTEEMWSTVCRTAFSLVIANAQDFACELLAPNGEPIVHSPRAMPVFNLALPRAVKAMLDAYPAETLVPGDVLVTNDPWLCAGHLFDIAIVTPVFNGSRLIGLTATVAHVADIGGTKNQLTTRELYEEGLQIPPMKLCEAGKPNETLFRLIRENVRTPEQVIGDIHAIMAANEIGARRLAEFLQDYAMPDLRALTEVVQSKSEQAMRAAIRAIPDGVYSGESWTKPVDGELRVPVKLTVQGDTIELDFEGAPAQLTQGAFNCTFNYTASAATYPLKCILTPQVRGNAGCYRPFVIKAPPSSIVNCSKPAPVSSRVRVGWYIAPAIFRALANAMPAMVQGFTGVSSNPRVYGMNTRGQAHSDIFFSGGGQGASAHADGKSGLLFPTSAANSSIELFEARIPVLLVEKTFLADSGGPGTYRGGLGQRIRMRKLYEDGCDTMVSFYPDTVRQPGLFGGFAGSTGGGRLMGGDGQVLHECGTGGPVALRSTDHVIEVTLGGGAGYGAPAQRARSAIEQDIAMGMVTEQGAARDYGFVRQPADSAASAAA